MKNLFKTISDLGITAAEFTRRSGISYPTLQRIHLGDLSVRASTLAKVKKIISQIQSEENTHIKTVNRGGVSS